MPDIDQFPYRWLDLRPGGCSCRTMREREGCYENCRPMRSHQYTDFMDWVDRGRLVNQLIRMHLHPTWTRLRVRDGLFWWMLVCVSIFIWDGAWWLLLIGLCNGWAWARSHK